MTLRDLINLVTDSFFYVVLGWIGRILAREEKSRINFGQWCWILWGSFFLHPLLAALAILSLAFHLRGNYVRLTVLFGTYAYGILFLPKGISSWNGTANYLQIPTSILEELLWIWLFGCLLFCFQLFQLSDQSREIRG